MDGTLFVWIFLAEIDQTNASWLRIVAIEDKIKNVDKQAKRTQELVKRHGKMKHTEIQPVVESHELLINKSAE